MFMTTEQTNIFDSLEGLDKIDEKQRTILTHLKQLCSEYNKSKHKETLIQTIDVWVDELIKINNYKLKTDENE